MSRPLRILCAIIFTFGVLPTPFTFATDDPSSDFPTSASDSPSEAIETETKTDDPDDSSPESSSETSPGSSESSETPDPSSEAESPPALEITTLDLLKQHFFIKSLNPGFKVDGVAETGEAIELANTADVSLPLDDVSLRYYNSSGTAYTLFEFEPGSQAVGASILLRYSKSPEIKSALEAETKVADSVYTKTLAMSGSLELVYSAGTADEVVFDSVCWTGKSGCEKKFTSGRSGTLVRDLETKLFSLDTSYLPEFLGGLYVPPAEDDASDKSLATASAASPQCQDLEFTELLSYYSDSASEQFLEIYNPTDDYIELSGCKIKYKNKSYDLPTTNLSTENAELEAVFPGTFYVYRPKSFKLTKNPNSENIVELIDVTSDVVSTAKYPHGQKKGTAYALIDGAWRTTYAPTPGSANVIQEFRSCPLGKIINESTGNCVKASTVASVTPCPAGKYRNPETGRCKSTASSSSSKACKEGYERNPETNRCRKIKTNNGTDYALVPITGDPEQTSFIAIWVLVALAAAGIAYALFQFRHEIAYSLRRLLSKFKK